MKLTRTYVWKICICLGALICAVSGSGLAQSNWLVQAGGGTNDEALGIDQDASQNSYVCGYFNSSATFGSQTVFSSGLSDIFVSKLDDQGNFIWTKSFGGSSPDRAFCIDTDSNGNSVIAGYFTGSIDFGGNNISAQSGSQDAFVAYINSNGDTEWAVPMGGPSGDIAYGVFFDPDGNVIVTGEFSGNGSFGSDTLVSETDPDTNSPSVDIFVAKISSNGDFIWAKKGSAPYDDSGYDVSCDSSGNIYLLGRFSEDIEFGNTYTNTIDNANCVVKFDPNGNDLWLVKLAALYLLGNDIHVDGANNILVVGDLQGQMAVIGDSGTETFDASYQHNYFLLKLSSSGSTTWASIKGSSSNVSARGLDSDASNNYYISGTFNCVFDEFSSDLGESLFHSCGYRDVFISKHGSSGSWQYARQFGGPYDDQCEDVTVKVSDHPGIAGGFAGYFNVPSTDEFVNTSSSGEVSVGLGSSCSNPNIGDYYSVESTGNRDIFVTFPYDDSAPYLDFFTHVGLSCNYDIQDMCINFCLDSIISCNDVELTANTQTYINPDYWEFAPNWEFDWSTGDNTINTDAESTGTYTVEITSPDGCYSEELEVEVVIMDPPDLAYLTDNVGEFTYEQTSSAIYQLCEGDTLIFFMEDFSTDNYYWSSTDGMIDDDTFMLTEDGEYFLYTVNEAGCTSTTQVEAVFNELPEPIDVGIGVYVDGAIVETDTVFICEGDGFSLAVYDLITGEFEFEDTGVDWYVSPFVPYTSSPFIASFYPDETDTFSIGAHLEVYEYEDCGVLEYDLDWDITVVVQPAPPNDPIITGDTLLCPGETGIIYVNGGANYEWFGPDSMELLNDSTILISEVGNYSVLSTTISEIGCMSDNSEAILVETFPIPQIVTFPGDGVICPGETVEIVAESGVSWQWVSPEGNVISNDNSIIADTPGFYHCIVTDATGCVLESNFVEISVYQSPFILAEDGTMFCDGSPLPVVIQTNPEADINWLPPLSGSDLEILIEEPGTYSVSVSLCDITNVLEITLDPSDVVSEITIGENAVLCPGQSMTLYGNPGMVNYNWLPGGMGADSLVVEEPGEYQLLTTDDVGCIGASEIFVVSSYPIDPPLTQDATICAGDVAQLEALGNEITWYSAEQEFISTGPLLITEEISENTQFLVTQQDDICESDFEDSWVLINPASLPVSLGEVNPGCAETDYTLQIENPSSVNYQWELPSGETFGGPVLNFNPILLSDSGWYSIFAFDSQCTGPVDSVWLDVQSVLNPFLDIPDTTLCEGDSLLLSPTVEFDGYEWLPGGATDPELWVTQSGNYSLLAINDNGCTGISNEVAVEVLLDGGPPVETEWSICYGETITLTQDESVDWYSVNGALLNTGASYTLNNVEEDIQLFTQTFEQFYCSSEFDSQLVTLEISTDHPEIDGMLEYCEGDMLMLTTDAIGPNYYWSTPGGIQTTQTLEIDPAQPEDSGEYWLVIESTNCESKSDTVSVLVGAYPDFSLDYYAHCQDGFVTFQMDPNFDEYYWNGEEGDNFFQTSGIGTVEFLAINFPGCSAFESLDISDFDCPNTFPNVFTPNGDTDNDFINFGMISSRLKEVHIYNRWGNLIRRLNGTNLVWAGEMDNGQMASEGVYYYILQFDGLVDGLPHQHGYIHLFR